MRQLQGHRRPIVLAYEIHRAGKGIEQGLDQRRLGIQGQWRARARGAARSIALELGRQHAVAEAQALGERPPLLRRTGTGMQGDHRGPLRLSPGKDAMRVRPYWFRRGRWVAFHERIDESLECRPSSTLQPFDDVHRHVRSVDLPTPLSVPSLIRHAGRFGFRYAILVRSSPER